ncbi:MAG: penicillin acylase family protein [Solirubrobacteraceae bacterium]
MRRALVAAACMLGAWSASASAATTLNVIPHGQFEPGVPWAGAPGLLPAETQANMYNRLTPLFRDVTDAQLQPSTDGSGYYKSSGLLAQDDPSFVASEVVSGVSPSAGPVTATIKRDNYGVPHIYSDTDPGVVFGAGVVVAEDRSLLIDQARFNGVAGLIDMPGVPAIQLVLGLYSYRPSKQVVDEVTAQQTQALQAAGPDGKRVLADIDTYIVGINAWYSVHKPSSPPITRTDIYSLNAIKAQFLGEGGGEEIANASMLDGLRSKLGSERGTQAYEDLRGRNDPETPTTTTKKFPWQTNVSVAKPKGVVNLVNGSFRSAGPKLPGAAGARAKAASVDHPRGPEQKASNILIASGKRSDNGSPLFVGGPQIGYNYPGLTLEMAEYGPHIRVRGATSAPFPGYMLIGRGSSDVWTLTSAGADMIDTYAEKLCGGSRTKYVYNGKCRSMTTVRAGRISKGGKSVSVTFRRTVHGPVLGYAKSRGSKKLVALSSKRSSYKRETTDQILFGKLTYGEVHNARDFVKAAATTPQTFNSFYANKTESAFFTSGLLPVRPTDVNPDLPTDGTGKYEWKKSYLAAAKHPQVINPADGYIVNWNNKPAKDFPAGDERWSENSLQRQGLLTAELNRRPQQTLASVLASANAAASEDVRIVEFWPTLKAMLAKGKAPSARAAKLASLLQAWHDAGGSRRDADGDGKIDDPGVAILDGAWRDLSSAGLCDRLGNTLCKQLEGRNGRFDQPPGGQYGGWHQYMWKDFRAMLGQKVKGRYHLRYCGNGSVKTCAKELWKAIDGAGKTLAAKQGPDPAAWRKAEAPEKIHFTPLPLIDMDYTNKPTGIHQVVTYGG